MSPVSRTRSMVIVSGAVYFVLVFAAGFFLGIIRVLVLVPRLGEGTAELMELPFMVLISFLSAKLVCRWFSIETIFKALIAGILALSLLVSFEFTLVLGLRGLSMNQYLESRDPAAFAAYIFSLVLFALMPSLVFFLNGAKKDTGV